MDENQQDPNLQYLTQQDTSWADEGPVSLWNESLQNVEMLDPDSYFDPIVDQCNRYGSGQDTQCRVPDAWEEDDQCVEDNVMGTFTAGPMEARRVLNNLPAPQFLSLDVLEDPNDRVPLQSDAAQSWNRMNTRNPFSMWNRPW